MEWTKENKFSISKRAFHSAVSWKSILLIYGGYEMINNQRIFQNDFPHINTGNLY